MDNNTSRADVEKTVNEDVKSDTEHTKKVKKHERRKFSYYFTNGLIMSWLGMLTENVYKSLCEGFFGRIFTSFSSNQNNFKNGFLNGRVFGHDRLHRYFRKARRFFAEGFENSFFLGFIKKTRSTLLETSVKNYGNYMLSFGLYTIFVCFVKKFLNFAKVPTNTDLLAGLIFILIAVPMLMSKNSLAKALSSSISARALLCDVFGIRDESFEVPLKQTKLRANLAIILGMVSGVLTFFISPVYIPTAILLVCGVAMIMVTPEIGVIVSLFVLPFMSFSDMPSVLLMFLVGVSALGYVVKLIRGKRIIKFEIVDAVVLMFSLMIFFSGLISAGGKQSFYEAGITCVLITVYFLVANMMRTKKWIDRCVLALVSSATVTSVLGIIEYFFGDLSTQWLDTVYFDDIRGRVVSLFDNSNVLAFYLVMAFPFALDLIFRCKNKSEKFLAYLSASAIVLCVVFTWSRGAWLGLIISTVVYLLIKTRIVIKALFGLCLALPIIAVVLPDNVINRFLSIGDISDSSTYYRVLTWRGSLDAISDGLVGGYGYGTSAFENAYPRYAYAGIEAAEHSHSLFLQVAFGMGIVGIVVFIIVILLFCQKNLQFFAKNDATEQTSVAVAAFASFVSAMVMGMFDYIWYNNRVMFLFWAIMGIACAVIRIGDDLAKRRQVEIVCDNTSAYIDI